MYDPVHEKIAVDAKFQNGKVQITKFRWKDKDHFVTEVHLTLKARKGREAVWIFNVSTSTAAYKLRLDSDTLQWWIEEHTWEEEPPQE